MALLELNRNPTRSELRQFGGYWLPAFLVVVGLMSKSWPLAAVLCGGAALSAILGRLRPEGFRGLFVGWMLLAYPIGWVVSHALLLAIYYGVITPVGLLMRWGGHDPMNRKLDRAATTYWVPRAKMEDDSRYFRQF